MLPFSPQLFAAVVTGALRLGKSVRELRQLRQVDAQDIRVLLPASVITDETASPEEKDERIRLWALSLADSEWQIDRLKAFPDMVAMKSADEPARDANNFLQIAPGMERLFETYLAQKFSAASKETEYASWNRLVAYRQNIWLESERPSRVGQFFLNAVDVGLDFVAVQPGILGAGGNMEGLLKAIAPNLALSFDASDVQGRSSADVLRDSFFEAALSTMVNQPGLITTEERWQPLITDVLTPLQHAVQKDGIREVIASRNLKDLIGGPMARGALAALDADPDKFFKGEMNDQKIVGQVFRQVLSVFADPGNDGMVVRQIFSQDGAVTVLNSALTVAKDRPELFLKANMVDDEVEYGRMLLSRMAGTFLKAPAPFGKDDGLAASLASSALEVVGQYANARMAAEASQHADSQLGVDVASTLLDNIITGFGRGLNGKPGNPFKDIFTRAQAVDVMKLVATHVARQPHLLVNKNEDESVVQLAQSVAAAIAADDDGMLGGDDWKKIVVVALDTALTNPGRLFGLDNSENPEQAVAVQLVERILSVAKSSMGGGPIPDGGVLFGETLASTIRVSLLAAGSGALAIAARNGKLGEHLDAVEHLIAKLNALAASDDPSKIIGAADWTDIFTTYIAHVLETGSVDAITDFDLLAVLKDAPLAPILGEGI